MTNRAKKMDTTSCLDVYLWDDSYFDFWGDFKRFFKAHATKLKGNVRNWSGEDEESNKLGEENLEVSLENGDAELSLEMAALGLPTAFQTSSEWRQIVKPRKRKGRKWYDLPCQEEGIDGPCLEVDETCACVTGSQLMSLTHLGERESVFVANLSVSNHNTTEDSTLGHVESGSAASFDGNTELGSKGPTTWVPFWDTYYQRYYFYNSQTFESTWDPPLGLEQYAYLHLGDEISGAVPKEEREQDFEATSQSSKEVESNFGITIQPQLETIHESDNTLVNGETVLEAFGLSSQLEPIVVLDVKGKDCSEILTMSERCEDTMAVQAKQESVDDSTIGRRRKKRNMNMLAKAGVDDLGEMFQGDLSPDVFKYWVQRYHLFSKFDEGVRLDKEGWFSVTHEAIARHHAKRCGSGVIVDAFTGVGGNAIQFALAGLYVIAIDIDCQKIEYAQHNASIYGVADRIDFVVADFFHIASSLKAETVYLSPPWGGPEYADAVLDYDILTMLQPKDGLTLLKVAQQIASNTIFYLPRNVNFSQLAELPRSAGLSIQCQVEKIFLNSKLKAVTAYYGEFGTRNDDMQRTLND